MRFSTMSLDSWREIAPFVDTLCLPIYSLEITKEKLELSRGKMIEFLVDSLEKQLAGRMLLLPSIPFFGDYEGEFTPFLTSILNNWQNSGFQFVVVVMDQDYSFQFPEVEPLQILPYVLKTDDIQDVEQIDEESKELYQEVLQLWLKNA
ncbi:Protein of unknown function [Seinonella peptonophila]|uniref:DUF2487 domain-containing protein n=1 Tax=Seinonella peptonophila TaxID=112248 RepID=A0A1M4TED0_9BACL|nr:DUF2487 family protein [Seinonella peptonophila]SHE42806.1 Protein of unknown function [Seinonella peptonophila]